LGGGHIGKYAIDAIIAASAESKKTPNLNEDGA
jgi:hypothetical protein